MALPTLVSKQLPPLTPADDRTARASSHRSDARARGRIRAAQDFNTAATLSTNRAIGARLGVDESCVRELRGNEKPLHLGDVYAMPADVAADLLRRVLDAVEQRPRVHMSPERHLLAVTRELGDVARELEIRIADGVLDADDRAVLRREIADARDRLDAMARDVDSTS